MITLHHCLSARSFRLFWMLEELGVPYELKVLPFPPRAKAREFLDVNPLGTVPAVFDGQVRMTESAAICQYLAARHSPGVMDVAAHEADFGRLSELPPLRRGDVDLPSDAGVALPALRIARPFAAADCRRLLQMVPGAASDAGACSIGSRLPLCRQIHCGGCFGGICVAARLASWLERALYPGYSCLLATPAGAACYARAMEVQHAAARPRRLNRTCARHEMSTGPRYVVLGLELDVPSEDLVNGGFAASSLICCMTEMGREQPAASLRSTAGQGRSADLRRDMLDGSLFGREFAHRPFRLRSCSPPSSRGQRPPYRRTPAGNAQPTSCVGGRGQTAVAKDPLDAPPFRLLIRREERDSMACPEGNASRLPFDPEAKFGAPNSLAANMTFSSRETAPLSRRYRQARSCRQVNLVDAGQQRPSLFHLQRDEPHNVPLCRLMGTRFDPSRLTAPAHLRPPIPSKLLTRNEAKRLGQTSWRHSSAPTGRHAVASLLSSRKYRRQLAPRRMSAQAWDCA